MIWPDVGSSFKVHQNWADTSVLCTRELPVFNVMYAIVFSQDPTTWTHIVPANIHQSRRRCCAVLSTHVRKGKEDYYFFSCIFNMNVYIWNHINSFFKVITKLFEKIIYQRSILVLRNFLQKLKFRKAVPESNTKNYIFKCHLLDFRFASRQLLLAHVRKVHKKNERTGTLTCPFAECQQRYVKIYRGCLQLHTLKQNIIINSISLLQPQRFYNPIAKTCIQQQLRLCHFLHLLKFIWNIKLIQYI